MTEYVIRGGAAGKARLAVIARELRPSTLSLLKRAGIGEGMACLIPFEFSRGEMRGIHF
jgi:hypothetical protein